jgi:hypothetical protein
LASYIALAEPVERKRKPRKNNQPHKEKKNKKILTQFWQTNVSGKRQRKKNKKWRHPEFWETAQASLIFFVIDRSFGSTSWDKHFLWTKRLEEDLHRQWLALFNLYNVLSMHNLNISQLFFFSIHLTHKQPDLRKPDLDLLQH